MQYYRCKCGKSTAYGTMGPNPCDGCYECGTTLDQAPELHRTPEPHQMEPTTVQTDDGQAVLHRCRWCGKTQAQIDKTRSASSANREQPK